MSFVSTYTSCSINGWQSENQNWGIQQTLTGNGGFGQSVTINSTGNTFTVSSYDANIAGNLYQGAVNVYNFYGNLERTLTQSYGQSNVNFGTDQAISPDGNMLLISAPGLILGNTRGSVFSFVRSNNIWTQNQIINFGTANNFGTSTAISGDGNIAAISYSSNNGGVVMYYKNGNSWTFLDSITNPSNISRIGLSLALNYSGNILMVGASNQSANNYFINEYNRIGNNWSIVRQISPPAPVGGIFGASISLNDSGNTLLIGRPSFNSKGTAYIYTNDGNNWTQLQSFQSTKNVTVDKFGISVDLNSDGTIGIIGCESTGNTVPAGPGSVCFISNVGNTWVSQQFDSNESGFGVSVAINSTGNISIVGSSDVNRAYMFVR